MKLRDVVIFLAGAMALHTVSHLIFPYFVALPLDMGWFILTPAFNTWVVSISAIVTVWLLWYASRLPN